LCGRRDGAHRLPVALWAQTGRTSTIGAMIGRLQRFPAPGLGEPAPSINGVLRSVRRAAGVSLDVLASRTNFSKPYLSNVESGRRRVTADIAEAYDAALDTGGLLARLFAGASHGSVGREAEPNRPRRPPAGPDRGP